MVMALLLFGVMPFLVLGDGHDRWYEGKFWFVYALAVGMLALMAMRGISSLRGESGSDPRKVAAFRPICLADWAVLGFGFCTVVSTLLSVDPRASVLGWPLLRDGLVSQLVNVIIYWFFSRMVPWRDALWIPCMFACAVVSALGVNAFFLGVDPSSGAAPVNLPPIGNRNFTGAWCTLLLPVSVGMVVRKRNLWWMGASAMLFQLMFASLTRSAWVALPVWLLMMTSMIIAAPAIADRGPMLMRLSLLLVGMIGGFILLDQLTGQTFSERFREMFLELGNLDSDETGSFRMNIWKSAWPLVDDRPWFGYGPDSLSRLLPLQPGLLERLRTGLMYVKAHNETLQMAICLGLPAVISWFAAVGGAFTNSCRLLRETWRIPLLCAVAGYVVQAQFNISMIAVAPLFWACVGWLAQSGAAAGPEMKQSENDKAALSMV